MNWEAIGSVGEVLSAIMVLASLPYIAIQVRDTKRATVRSERHNRNNMLTRTVFETPDLAAVIAQVTAVDGQNTLRKELQRKYSLSPGDLELYYYYLAFVWRSIEIDFLTARDQMEVDIVIERRLQQPSFRMFIDAIGPRFSPDFMSVVNRVKSQLDDERTSV